MALNSLLELGSRDLQSLLRTKSILKDNPIILVTLFIKISTKGKSSVLIVIVDNIILTEDGLEETSKLKQSLARN